MLAQPTVVDLGVASSAVAVGFYLAMLAVRRFPVLGPKYRARPIMTRSEQACFQLLTRALPEFHIFPQVGMGAIVDTPRLLTQRRRRGVRSTFDRKIVDFVVVQRTSFAIVALIELDDPTHDPTRDQRRDRITSAAGYRTYRFSRRPQTIEEVRARLGLRASAGSAELARRRG